MYQHPYGYPQATWPQMNPYGQQQGVPSNQYVASQQAAMYGQQQAAASMFNQQHAAAMMYGQQQVTASMYGQQQAAASMYGQQQVATSTNNQQQPRTCGQQQAATPTYNQQAATPTYNQQQPPLPPSGYGQQQAATSTHNQQQPPLPPTYGYQQAATSTYNQQQPPLPPSVYGQQQGSTSIQNQQQPVASTYGQQQPDSKINSQPQSTNQAPQAQAWEQPQVNQYGWGQSAVGSQKTDPTSSNATQWDQPNQFNQGYQQPWVGQQKWQQQGNQSDNLGTIQDKRPQQNANQSFPHRQQQGYNTMQQNYRQPPQRQGAQPQQNWNRQFNNQNSSQDMTGEDAQTKQWNRMPQNQHSSPKPLMADVITPPQSMQKQHQTNNAYSNQSHPPLPSEQKYPQGQEGNIPPPLPQGPPLPREPPPSRHSFHPRSQVLVQPENNMNFQQRPRFPPPVRPTRFPSSVRPPHSAPAPRLAARPGLSARPGVFAQNNTTSIRPSHKPSANPLSKPGMIEAVNAAVSMNTQTTSAIQLVVQNTAPPTNQKITSIKPDQKPSTANAAQSVVPDTALPIDEESLSSLQEQLETLEQQIKTYQEEYQKWHKDFVTWQKQHQNHPDQKQYIDYQKQYQKMIEEQQAQLKKQYAELQKKITKRRNDQKCAGAAKIAALNKKLDGNKTAISSTHVNNLKTLAAHSKQLQVLQNLEDVQKSEAKSTILERKSGIVRRPANEYVGVPCKFFPKCRSGNKCKFEHPMCASTNKCTDPQCQFEHPLDLDMAAVKANEGKNSAAADSIVLKLGPAEKSNTSKPADTPFLVNEVLNTISKTENTSVKKDYPKPAVAEPLQVHKGKGKTQEESENQSNPMNNLRKREYPLGHTSDFQTPQERPIPESPDSYPTKIGRFDSPSKPLMTRDNLIPEQPAQDRSLQCRIDEIYEKRKLEILGDRGSAFQDLPPHPIDRGAIDRPLMERGLSDRGLVERAPLMDYNESEYERRKREILGTLPPLPQHDEYERRRKEILEDRFDESLPPSVHERDRYSRIAPDRDLREPYPRDPLYPEDKLRVDEPRDLYERIDRSRDRERFPPEQMAYSPRRDTYLPPRPLEPRPSQEIVSIDYGHGRGEDVLRRRDPIAERGARDSYGRLYRDRYEDELRHDRSKHTLDQSRDPLDRPREYYDRSRDPIDRSKDSLDHPRDSYGRRDYDRRDRPSERESDLRQPHEPPSEYIRRIEERERERNDRDSIRDYEMLYEGGIDRPSESRHRRDTHLREVELKPEVFSAADILDRPGRDTRPKNIVIILRGIPGSGKSFVAKLIKEKESYFGAQPPRILALDDYFMQEVEKMEKVPNQKKIVLVKKQEYVYETEMEEPYRASLLKAFNKTLTDGFFPMVIVDAINDKTKYFDQFWSDAKHKGFEVYIADVEGELNECLERCIHKRPKEEVEEMLRQWEKSPVYYKRLDVSALLQDAAIDSVEMEEAADNPELEAKDKEERSQKEEEEEEEELPTTFHIPKSKWESSREETLAKLDGFTKRKTKDTKSASPIFPDEDDDDDPYGEKEADMRLGRKRVRWADIEQKKQIDHQRKIGFSIGMDWNILTDPHAQIPH